MSRLLLHIFFSAQAARTGAGARSTRSPSHCSFFFRLRSFMGVLPHGLVRWWRGTHARLQGIRNLVALSCAIVDGWPKVDFRDIIAVVRWNIGVFLASGCPENTSSGSLNRLIRLTGFVCACVIDASVRRGVIVMTALAADPAPLTLRWRWTSIRIGSALTHRKTSLIVGVVVNNLVGCDRAAAGHTVEVWRSLGGWLPVRSRLAGRAGRTRGPAWAGPEVIAVRRCSVRRRAMARRRARIRWSPVWHRTMVRRAVARRSTGVGRSPVVSRHWTVGRWPMPRWGTGIRRSPAIRHRATRTLIRPVVWVLRVWGPRGGHIARGHG